MHDQRNLTQDAILRAQIAMANRLIAEQSTTIAKAHSAIERAMETLRGPDVEGPTRAMCTHHGSYLAGASPSGRAEATVELAKSTRAVIHQTSAHHYRSADDQYLIED